MAIFINDLLRSSFRCIGQLRPGFGHSPSELVDALFILNAMLDSWSTDDLNCAAEVIQSFTYTPGLAVYTLGTGGIWNGARPTRIDKATLVVLTNPASPLRLDIEILDGEGDEYQSINVQNVASDITTKLWYNPTFPLGTVSVWPVPVTANNIELSSSQALAGGFTAGTTAFVAPPGYLDAVRYQLAIRLAMEWDKPLKDGVMMLATEALAKIQRLNADTPQLELNHACPGLGGRGGFNRLTGE